MQKRKRQFKIYREKAKDRHVSHWDWDYVSHAELEALTVEKDEAGEKATSPNLLSKVLKMLNLPCDKTS